MNPLRGSVQGNELSLREQQTLLGIAVGKTLMEISKELNLDWRTVTTYRNRLLEKLGLKNNAQIAVYAYREGITSWPPGEI